jgi:hypothetical protein
VKTDNGPTFQSILVRQFMFNNIIKHRKITPLWPRANETCERFMKIINRLMKNRKVDEENLREELEAFLSQYRATPHDSTGIVLAQLMLKTKSTTSGLPNSFKAKGSECSLEKLARKNDFKAIKAMKCRMDK